MGTLIIRHKVKDYSKWRPEFDQHASAQKSAGLSNPRVFRSSDDPNEVVIFFTQMIRRKPRTLSLRRTSKALWQKLGS